MMLTMMQLFSIPLQMARIYHPLYKEFGHPQLRSNIKTRTCPFVKIWNKLLSDRPKYERIQATVHENFDDGIRFLDFLGFTNEGLMQKFGPDKSNFYRYAYIRHGPN